MFVLQYCINPSQTCKQQLCYWIQDITSEKVLGFNTINCIIRPVASKNVFFNTERLMLITYVERSVSFHPLRIVITL